MAKRTARASFCRSKIQLTQDVHNEYSSKSTFDIWLMRDLGKDRSLQRIVGIIIFTGWGIALFISIKVIKLKQRTTSWESPYSMRGQHFSMYSAEVFTTKLPSTSLASDLACICATLQHHYVQIQYWIKLAAWGIISELIRLAVKNHFCHAATHRMQLQ